DSHIVASSLTTSSTISDGFLAARLSAAATTFVLPGAQVWPTFAYVGLLVMGFAVAATALHARRGGASGPFRVWCAVAMVAGVLPLFVAHPDTVSSILIACPLLTAGLCLLHPRTLSPAARLLAVTAAGFTVLVIALQYNQGGGAEWGAR